MVRNNREAHSLESLDSEVDTIDSRTSETEEDGHNTNTRIEGEDIHNMKIKQEIIDADIQMNEMRGRSKTRII